MQFYFSHSNDPYYNLALEEYLLRNSKEDILLCYINAPSVVLGRFQVPYREINASFVHHNDITIARRLSGGGTVYHDLGNLNYSYITSCLGQTDNYYDVFNQKTIDVLSYLGLKNLSFQRNNIFCEGKKISGVAQYKRGNRMVHHGTLLVNADLEQLRALFTVKDYYQSRGVASVSSSVSNINAFVSLSMTDVLNAFEFSCVDKAQAFLAGKEVEKMAQYYSTLEWVFGKSPKYTIEKSELYIEVEKGRIKHISAPKFSDLIGMYHCYTEIAAACDDVDFLF
jgi:lipoate-protein ligase A